MDGQDKMRRQMIPWVARAKQRGCLTTLFQPPGPHSWGEIGGLGDTPKPSAEGRSPYAHPLLHGAEGGTGEAKLAREPNPPTDNPVTLAFPHNWRLRLTWVATVPPLAFRRHPICDVYLEAGVILRPQR